MSAFQGFASLLGFLAILVGALSLTFVLAAAMVYLVRRK